MSIAALALAGCSATGPDRGDSTTPVPRDTLAVTLRGDGVPAFRVSLDCAVADRQACAQVLDALDRGQRLDGCRPVPAAGSSTVEVTGTIGGQDVRQLVTRRTTCERETYDGVVAGAGL